MAQVNQEYEIYVSFTKTRAAEWL